VTNIDTPANHTFLAAMAKRFGSDAKTPNDLSVPEYDAVYLYKAAVEKAGSFDTAKVIPALAQVSFDGPRGRIQMNKERHTPLSMYLAQVQGDGGVKVIASYKDVDPGAQCPALK
jgi:urea transport system substrate-binding protein